MIVVILIIIIIMLVIMIIMLVIMIMMIAIILLLLLLLLLLIIIIMSWIDTVRRSCGLGAPAPRASWGGGGFETMCGYSCSGYSLLVKLY